LIGTYLASFMLWPLGRQRHQARPDRRSPSWRRSCCCSRAPGLWLCQTRT